MARKVGCLPGAAEGRTLTPQAPYWELRLHGFTASLAFELEAFGIRVKLVQPGYGPSTRFTSNGHRPSRMFIASTGMRRANAGKVEPYPPSSRLT